MQGGATRRRVVSHFSTKIPLRRYFSGSAAVGYSLLFVSLLLTPYNKLTHGCQGYGGSGSCRPLSEERSVAMY